MEIIKDWIFTTANFGASEDNYLEDLGIPTEKEISTDLFRFDF